MPLSRTTRLAALSGDGFGTGVYTTGSFTPANNSTLVVVVQATAGIDIGFRGSDITIDDTGADLTWSSRVVTGDSPGWSYGSRIFTAPVSTGVSMTISVDAGTHDITNYQVLVLEYTSTGGGTIGTGATATGSDADGNGAAAITLSGAPSASSEVVAIANISSAGAGMGAASAGSGWTEVNETARDGWFTFHTQARTGSTSTSVDWDDLESTGATTNVGAVLAALEITVTGESAAAGAVIVNVMGL